MAGCWDQVDFGPSLVEATVMSDRTWRAYKKTAVTMAQQQTEDFEVETLEGRMRGHAGDYLCMGPAGEQWPIRKEIFEATYEQLEDIVELPTELPDPTTGTA